MDGYPESSHIYIRMYAYIQFNNYICFIFTCRVMVCLKEKIELAV